MAISKTGRYRVRKVSTDQSIGTCLIVLSDDCLRWVQYLGGRLWLPFDGHGYDPESPPSLLHGLGRYWCWSGKIFVASTELTDTRVVEDVATDYCSCPSECLEKRHVRRDCGQKRTSHHSSAFCQTISNVALLVCPRDGGHTFTSRRIDIHVRLEPCLVQRGKLTPLWQQPETIPSAMHSPPLTSLHPPSRRSSITRLSSARVRLHPSLRRWGSDPPKRRTCSRMDTRKASSGCSSSMRVWRALQRSRASS